MSDVAIRVEHLAKQYRIGRRASYKTFRESLINLAARTLSRGDSSAQTDSHTTFYALDDVSFDVNRGDVLGIIGRNGAGKSTLLKVLSRITEPTTGRIEIDGRVGSLLEVGTGFHPELTGRENVYLNGAILGMRQSEIASKFDEIVAFAEVEKFLDTQVKHYSSGMYTRLAFAVAAHLEPEVLIVDEVLAVGDAEFQRKCMGKMHSVAREGKTVLFVSHNMGAINRLCSKAIWLQQGKLRGSGTAAEMVNAYMSSGSADEGEVLWPIAGAPLSTAPGNDSVRLRAVRVLAPEGVPTATVDVQRPFEVEIELDVLKPIASMRTAIRFLTVDGTVVLNTAQGADPRLPAVTESPGKMFLRCHMPGDFLNVAQYALTVSADVPFVQVIFMEENVLTFTVEQTGGVGGLFPEPWPGVVCPRLAWTRQTSDAHSPNDSVEQFSVLRKV